MVGVIALVMQAVGVLMATGATAVMTAVGRWLRGYGCSDGGYGDDAQEVMVVGVRVVRMRVAVGVLDYSESP